MEGDSVPAKGGGFLHMFDWKRKSRRKLFASNSPEGGRISSRADDDGHLSTDLQLVVDGGGSNDDDIRVSRVKEANESSCASSLTDGEQDGIRAPGIVARLMGLDSMPSPGVSDASCLPFDESTSIKNGASAEIDLGGSFVDGKRRTGACARTIQELKLQKVPGSPIERFQRERLPSRMAKPRPGARYNMFSLIRSPTGTLSKDAAAPAMETSVRILDTGRHQVSSKGRASGETRLPLPLRAYSSKERGASSCKTQRFLEKSENTAESSSPNPLAQAGRSVNFIASQECDVISQVTPQLPGIARRKAKSTILTTQDGKSLNNGSSNFRFNASQKVSGYKDGDLSLGSEDRRKSISLAIQAKINVQRREGLHASGREQVDEIVEDGLVKPPLALKYQAGSANDHMKRKSPSNNSVVLKQNNQKQNCLTNNDNLHTENKKVDHHVLEVSSRSLHSSGRSDPPAMQYAEFKSGWRMRRKQKINSGKEALPAAFNLSKRKQSAGRGNRHSKSDGSNEISMAEHDKCIQSHVIRGSLEECQGSKKPSTDIVSFTFSTRMVKKMKEPPSIEKKVIKNEAKGDSTVHSNEVNASHCNKKEYSSHCLDNIKGDALSILLDQKLQELSLGLGLDSSVSELTKNNDSPTASVSNSLPYHCDCTALVDLEDEDMSISRSCETYDTTDMSTSRSSLEGQVFSVRQGLHVAENCVRSTRTDITKESDYPCTDVSLREDSPSNRSCPSPEICNGEVRTMDSGAEPSNLLTESQNEEHWQSIQGSGSTKSCVEETEYVKEILFMVNAHLKDFITTLTSWSLDPFLFDTIGYKKNKSLGSKGGKVERLRRKVVFDCMSECLDTKCNSYFCAGYQSWIKGVANIKCGEISEEIHKETLGWDRMENWLVDELVDKDMSSKIGRWIDFEIDKFEIGIEMQNEILSALVGEVAVELLVSASCSTYILP